MPHIRSKTDAKLIFVTTSYVPMKEMGRNTTDPKNYNAAAISVMKKHGLPVNDIYKKSKRIHKKYGIGLIDVHYSNEGYKLLAEYMSSFLEKELD